MRSFRWPTFEERFGKLAESYGFTQITNVFIHNLKDFGLKPRDAMVVLYIWSRGPDTFTSAGDMADALNLHKNSITASFRKLTKMGYVRRIYSKGNANRFDLSGLESKIKAYIEFGIIPIQKLDRPDDKKSFDSSQNLDTKKQLTKEKIDELRRIAFPEKKKKKDEL